MRWSHGALCCLVHRSMYTLLSDGSHRSSHPWLRHHAASPAACAWSAAQQPWKLSAHTAIPDALLVHPSRVQGTLTFDRDATLYRAIVGSIRTVRDYVEGRRGQCRGRVVRNVSAMYLLRSMLSSAAARRARALHWHASSSRVLLMSMEQQTRVQLTALPCPLLACCHRAPHHPPHFCA